jgi:hypothetical protein
MLGTMNLKSLINVPTVKAFFYSFIRMGRNIGVTNIVLMVRRNV